MTTTAEAIETAAPFRHMDAAAQAGALGAILQDVNPSAIKLAVEQAPSPVQRAALEGGRVAFPDVSPADRRMLYLTVILILGVLAAGSLIGAAIALGAGKESAAFFTFSGLALGGITGLFIPSPAGKT